MVFPDDSSYEDIASYRPLVNDERFHVIQPGNQFIVQKAAAELSDGPILQIEPLVHSVMRIGGRRLARRSKP